MHKTNKHMGKGGVNTILKDKNDNAHSADRNCFFF